MAKSSDTVVSFMFQAKCPYCRAVNHIYAEVDADIVSFEADTSFIVDPLVAHCSADKCGKDFAVYMAVKQIVKSFKVEEKGGVDA